MVSQQSGIIIFCSSCYNFPSPLIYVMLCAYDANVSFSSHFLYRLVATLGAKSNLKKVNRKDILNVNVPKACNTIIAPDAPMALRLQSNLL